MGNFHDIAFDDATKLKLEIYRLYLEAWLPVFVMQDTYRGWSGKINVFDFFSGPGKDSNGEIGSPLIAIESCRKSLGLLTKRNRKVSLWFSDKMTSKTKSLTKELETQSLPGNIKYDIDTGEFIDVFNRSLDEMSNAANLLFIDQCGIKEVNEAVFTKLTNLPRSDFLFFFASSHYKRFRESKEFKAHIGSEYGPNHNTKNSDTHREIADMYRRFLPSDKDYYIAPFSLKKGANIYGLIFGTGNLLGISKFLEICWKIDPERGEANFDIDGDNLPKSGQNLDMFSSNDTANKVTVFQNEIKEAILEGRLKSDFEVYRYSLENGFLPVKHSKPVVKKLINQGLIICSPSPRLSKTCMKEPRTIQIV